VPGRPSQVAHGGMVARIAGGASEGQASLLLELHEEHTHPARLNLDCGGVLREGGVLHNEAEDDVPVGGDVAHGPERQKPLVHVVHHAARPHAFGIVAAVVLPAPEPRGGLAAERDGAVGMASLLHARDDDRGALVGEVDVGPQRHLEGVVQWLGLRYHGLRAGRGGTFTRSPS
jgi:hypothetical protein